MLAIIAKGSRRDMENIIGKMEVASKVILKMD